MDDAFAMHELYSNQDLLQDASDLLKSKSVCGWRLLQKAPKISSLSILKGYDKVFLVPVDIQHLHNILDILKWHHDWYFSEESVRQAFIGVWLWDLDFLQSHPLKI